MLRHTTPGTRALRFFTYLALGLVMINISPLFFFHPAVNIIISFAVISVLYNFCLIGKTLTFVFGHKFLYSRVYEHLKGDKVIHGPSTKTGYFVGFSNSSHVVISKSKDISSSGLTEVHIASYFAFYKNIRLNRHKKAEKKRQVKRSKQSNQERLFNSVKDEPLNDLLSER